MEKIARQASEIARGMGPPHKHIRRVIDRLHTHPIPGFEHSEHEYINAGSLLAVINAAHLPPSLRERQSQTALQYWVPAMAWRATKGVYSFDPDLFDQLTQTPLEGDLPTEVLTRLPEWCVWVNVDERITLSWAGPVVGFFAYVHRLSHGDNFLQMVLAFRGPEGLEAVGLPLRLRGTLAESIEYQESLSEKYSDALHSRPPNLNLSEVAPLVNLVLYLCAPKLDIQGEKQGHTPHKPKAHTRRGKAKLPKARHTHIWRVGAKIGQALRKAKQAPCLSEGPGDARAPTMPHVRRAHWHLYWVGKGRKTPCLKWIAPTLVNADPGFDGPVVVRPVE